MDLPKQQSNRFKDTHSFEKRCQDARAVRTQYPERVPVIIEVAKGCQYTLDKHKYLVPNDLTAGQFMYVVRKRSNISEDRALFLFTHDGALPAISMLMTTFYESYKDKDGFLYLLIASESTFGHRGLC